MIGTRKAVLRQKRVLSSHPFQLAKSKEWQKVRAELNLTGPPFWLHKSGRQNEKSQHPPGMKGEKLIAQIRKALLPYQTERIYIFGSLARGEADELSDVDLVIIKQTDKSLWDRDAESTIEDAQPPETSSDAPTPPDS